VRRSLLVVTIVFATALLLGVGGAAQNYVRARAFDQPYNWGIGLTDSISEWMLIAALTPLPILAVRRYRLRRAGVHVAAALLFAVGAVAAIAALNVLRRPDLSFPFVAVKIGIFYLIYYFAIYWAVAGIAHAAESARLEEQLTRERLEVLRSKLNPHFLFNTLNAISAMSLQRNHEGVTQSIGLVGDILRAALDDSLPQEIPLARELELAEKYLAIQHLRFGDRLRIERNIDPRALDGLVPSMVLQPILENAVVHGVAAHPGPGWIRIEARPADGRLQVSVSDSGGGFREAPRDGIGLTNTRERLRALYGSAHRFETGRQVEITIPMKEGR
jgi:signal transduction histidine kinase